MKTTAAALLVVTGMVAQADEPKTLTLACQGAWTDSMIADDKPQTISMGIVVNFTDRTVQGFGDPGSFLGIVDYYPVKITGWDDVTVSFEGRSSNSQKDSLFHRRLSTVP